jgi:hypothetical protein
MKRKTSKGIPTNDFDPKEEMRTVLVGLSGGDHEEEADALYKLILYARDNQGPIDQANLDAALEMLFIHTTRGRKALDNWEESIAITSTGGAQ